jgi:predicted secreted protein
MKHINTLTWVEGEDIHLKVQFFYKEKREFNIVIPKERIEEIDKENNNRI